MEIKKGDRVRLCDGTKGIIVGSTTNFGFPMFEIKLQSGKVVTEARYRFDVFPELQTVSNSPLVQMQNSPVLLQSPESTTPPDTDINDMIIAEILQEDMEHTEHDQYNIVSVGQDDALQSDTAGLVDPNKENNPEVHSSRFTNPRIDNADIDKFCFEQTNSNTMRKTKSDTKILIEFLANILGETRDICKIPAVELNTIICKFVINLHQRDGSEYEPFSIRGMISSFDRHLRASNYGSSIMKGEAFDQARRVINAKTKELKKMGKGNKPNKAQPLSDDEVNKLYETGQMGLQHPESLLRMLWFLNTVHFGMRTVTEHVNMKWGDIKLCTTNTGNEYLQYAERITKTRTGENPANIRDVPPKSWKNTADPSRCHVEAFKKYRDLRPPTYSSDTDPFYISTNTVFGIKSNKWFKSQPVGVNKISAFMKIMISNAGTLIRASCRLTIRPH